MVLVCKQPLGGWVEKLQNPSQYQLIEEQSQHKMPQAKPLQPNVFDFISAKGLFSPPGQNQAGAVSQDRRLLLLTANFSQRANHSPGIFVLAAGG